LPCPEDMLKMELVVYGGLNVREMEEVQRERRDQK
jgi:hypothetical protein